MWPGPYDPDEEMIEIIAISETAETSEFSPPPVTSISVPSEEEVARETAIPSAQKSVSSIRRRVSMFEATSTDNRSSNNAPDKIIFAGIQKRKQEKAEKPAVQPAPAPGKMSMLEEMKAKALKRQAKS